MRRSVWQEVGGFAEHLRSAEDLLFIGKVDDAGFKIAYAPAALVSWNMQPSLSRTFKRFVTYSRSNLKAGLGRQWQTAILSRYLFLLVVTVMLYLFTVWWPLVIAVLLCLMFVARSVAVLWRNRKRFPASAGRNVLRILMLIPLLITLDAATIAGTVDWLLRDKMHLLNH